jgi:hypothetical protein
VLAFNYLTGLITREETGLNSAAGELLDTIEGWAEDEVHHRQEERAAHAKPASRELVA